MKSFLISLILMLSINLCFAQNVPQVNIEKKVLDNGLNIVVKPEAGTGLVSIIALVKAGTANESIQNSGIGVFVSRLLLASTRQKSADDIASIANQVGGNINTERSEDFIALKIVTTAEMFNTSVSITAEILSQANFEDKWVEVVRKQLMEDYQKEDTDIFRRAYDKVRAMLYEDNGYNKPYLGSLSVIQSLSINDLKKYYKTFFVPNNIVISVVGDITPSQVYDRFDKAFAGEISKPLPKVREVPYEELDRSKSNISEANIGAAYMIMGWLAPGVNNQDYASMLVLNNILGQGKSSLLFTELRQKAGIGYEVGTMYPRLVNQSHLSAVVITDPYKQSIPGTLPEPILDIVRAKIVDVASMLKKSPVTDLQLQRGKGYAIGTFALSHQHLIDRAYDLAWFEASGLGYKLYTDFPQLIEKVTKTDVQKVAVRYINNYAVVVLVPKS